MRSGRWASRIREIQTLRSKILGIRTRQDATRDTRPRYFAEQNESQSKEPAEEQADTKSTAMWENKIN